MPHQPPTDSKTGPSFSPGNRIARQCWNVVSALLFRPSPRPLHAWRALLLRAFGARLGAGCHIYPKAAIWAPWNLECGDGACIADGAEIYNPSPIKIGAWSVVSQGAFLCGASHDYRTKKFPLIHGPITVGEGAWIGARAIVLMGIAVGKKSVVGAGSVVTKDVPPRVVCAGNPCRVIKPVPNEGGA